MFKILCFWVTLFTNPLFRTMQPTSLRLFYFGTGILPVKMAVKFLNAFFSIGQVLLSLLHAWGLDKDLDKVAISKLGLLKPKVPVSYGLMSKGGVMALMLPTWKMKQNENVDFFTGKYPKI